MSISKQFKILSVKAEPQLHDKENVITYVFWAVEFEMGNFSNQAVVETLINFDPESVFIPAENLTKEQILSWAIEKQGGDVFLEHLEHHHTLQLQADRALEELVALPLPFVEGATLSTEQPAEDTTDAYRLASDREYIRGLVLDVLEEQKTAQNSGA